MAPISYYTCNLLHHHTASVLFTIPLYYLLAQNFFFKSDLNQKILFQSKILFLKFFLNHDFSNPDLLYRLLKPATHIYGNSEPPMKTV